MKHAGPATLERIAPLLEQLRARSALREVGNGRFTLKSKAFLHFHDDPAGVFADARLDGPAGDFVRMRVTTTAEQADLIDRIDECLDAVAAHTKGRHARDEARGGKRSQ